MFDHHISAGELVVDGVQGEGTVSSDSASMEGIAFQHSQRSAAFRLIDGRLIRLLLRTVRPKLFHGRMATGFMELLCRVTSARAAGV